MSLISSAASGDSVSDSSELGCEPLPSVRSIPTAEQFSLDIGRGSPSTGISAPSPPKLFATPTSSSITAGLIKNPEEVAERFRQSGRSRGHFGNVLLRQALTSSAEASPVRTSASPARELVLQERGVGSGANTTDSFASFDPDTSSWRTSQRCLVEGWARYSETWPRSGMTRNGTAYRLPTLAPLTDEIASGSLPTPTADKCVASELTQEMAERFHRKGRSGSFVEAVAGRMWPMPRASEWKGTGPLGSKSHEYRLAKNYLDATVQEAGQTSGALNPTWVEWLMGFPLGWTVLEHWVTRSSRKSSRSSDGQS